MGTDSLKNTVVDNQRQPKKNKVQSNPPRWSPKCMGYQGLWGRRGMLKIDSKNRKKIAKNTEKIRDMYWM